MNHLRFDNILSKFSADVGIDLGTSNTPLIVKGTGVKLMEPSFISYDVKKKKIIAVGNDAKAMYGRNHSNIQIVRPVKDSVIGNFEMASAMIEYMLRRIKNYGLFRPRVMIGVPTYVSEVERKAIQEAARLAGARVVYIIDQPIAAALGAGLPIMESRASTVLDLGGGTSEISVVSLGGIVVSRSTKVAGEKMDEAVQSMVKRKYNLLIGENTAEEIKILVGRALPATGPARALVKGRDLTNGLPRAAYVGSDDVFEALKECVQGMAELVKNCLEFTPPELMGDIIDQGIVMTGGLSQLPGLDEVFAQYLKIPFKVAQDPSFCVARGIEKTLKDPRLMENIFRSRKKKRQTSSCYSEGSESALI